MLAVMDGLQLQWLSIEDRMAECFERFVVVLEPALANRARAEEAFFAALS